MTDIVIKELKDSLRKEIADAVRQKRKDNKSSDTTLHMTKDELKRFIRESKKIVEDFVEEAKKPKSGLHEEVRKVVVDEMKSFGADTPTNIEEVNEITKPDTSGVGDALKPKWIKKGKSSLSYKKADRQAGKKLSGKTKAVSETIANADKTEERAKKSKPGVFAGLSDKLYQTLVKLLSKIESNTRTSKSKTAPTKTVPGQLVAGGAAVTAASKRAAKSKKKSSTGDGSSYGALGRSFDVVEGEMDDPMAKLAMVSMRHQTKKFKDWRAEKNSSGGNEPESLAKFDNLKTESKIIKDDPTAPTGSSSSSSGNGWMGAAVGAAAALASGVKSFMRRGEKPGPDPKKPTGEVDKNGKKLPARDPKTGRFIKTAEKNAAKAAEKTGAKAVAKGAGKSLLKKLPGIGLVAGLAFGASRAMSGDWAGAAGEVASGALSTVPGIGTAASMAIDAGLAIRDNNRSEELEKAQEKVEAKPQVQQTPPQVNNSPVTNNNMMSGGAGGGGKGIGTRNVDSSFVRYLDSRTFFA